MKIGNTPVPLLPPLDAFKSFVTNIKAAENVCNILWLALTHEGLPVEPQNLGTWRSKLCWSPWVNQWMVWLIKLHNNNAWTTLHGCCRSLKYWPKAFLMSLGGHRERTIPVNVPVSRWKNWKPATYKVRRDTIILKLHKESGWPAHAGEYRIFWQDGWQPSLFRINLWQL